MSQVACGWVLVARHTLTHMRARTDAHTTRMNTHALTYIRTHMRAGVTHPTDEAVIRLDEREWGGKERASERERDRERCIHTYS